MSTPSDEIDFEPILAKIYTIAKKIFTFFLSFFSFVLKHFKKIFIGSIICALLSMGLSFLIKPLYEVRMSLSTNYLGHLLIDDFVDDVNHLIETESFQVLSEKLALTNEEVQSIEELTSRSTDVFIHFGDTANNEFIYYIHADLYSQEILPKLQVGILNALEKNPLVQSNRESRRFYFEKSITRIQKDINSLDSIIKRVEENIGDKNRGNTVILNKPINPSELIQQKNNLSNNLVLYQRELNDLNEFRLIQNFETSQKPIFPKKSLFLVVGFLVGAIVSMVIIKKRNSY